MVLGFWRDKGLRGYVLQGLWFRILGSEFRELGFMGFRGLVVIVSMDYGA